jgi:hypothetical protein
MEEGFSGIQTEPTGIRGIIQFGEVGRLRDNW